MKAPAPARQHDTTPRLSETRCEGLHRHPAQPRDRAPAAHRPPGAVTADPCVAHGWWHTRTRVLMADGARAARRGKHACQPPVPLCRIVTVAAAADRHISLPFAAPDPAIGLSPREHRARPCHRTRARNHVVITPLGAHAVPSKSSTGALVTALFEALRGRRHSSCSHTLSWGTRR